MSDEYANDVILVEFPETPGLQPVSIRTLSVDSLAEKSVNALDKAMGTIRSMATRAVDAVKGLSDPPDEVELSFGIKLDAEAGAMVAKASTEASINVTLTWQREEEKKKPLVKGLMPSKE